MANRIAYFTSQSVFWEVPTFAQECTVYYGQATDLLAIYKELQGLASEHRFDLILLSGHKSNIRNDLFIRKISREFNVECKRI